MLTRQASRLVSQRCSSMSTRVATPALGRIQPLHTVQNVNRTTSTSASTRVFVLTSQPTRAYSWNKFFENAKDPTEEDWGVTPEEKENVMKMLNETELELEAQLEPLWGASRPDAALAGTLKAQIDQWEQFIRSTPDVKPIDFNYYRSRADPELVNALEAEYKAIKVNDQVIDLRSSFEPHYKALEQRYADLNSQIGALTRELDVQIEKLKDRKARIPTLTLEDIMNERPELQEQMVEEIEADGFALHNLLRYKGDVQFEAQYRAQEEHHDAHDHAHGH